MHHALEIQEILSAIFLHLSPQLWNVFLYGFPYITGPDPALAALARTCRAFKEPALDALWYALRDLTPLVQCLPEASRRRSFKRWLTPIEWDILRSYTRRIRYVMHFNHGLDWDSVATFMIPPTPDPLFPNLRNLRYDCTMKDLPLLHMPLPSLTSLSMKFKDRDSLQNSIELFPKFSPDIREFLLSVQDHKIELDWIYRWKNLHLVDFPRTIVDMDALVHLSRMPMLKRLHFTLGAVSRTSDAPLVYSNLEYLKVRSASINPISGFLSQTRLPIITSFVPFVSDCPSKQELSSFWISISTSNPGHTVGALTLFQPFLGDGPVRYRVCTLGLEDLLPCTVLGDLRELLLDVQYDVDLTEGRLLTLASAWPKLESFVINRTWGWTMSLPQGGVTPGGLLRLLQTCPRLSSLGLCLNTRGYTQVVPSETPEALGLTFRHRIHVNALDAAIDQESVRAVITFLFDLTAYCEDFDFGTWNDIGMIRPSWKEYDLFWNQVRRAMRTREQNNKEMSGT